MVSSVNFNALQITSLKIVKSQPHATLNAGALATGGDVTLQPGGSPRNSGKIICTAARQTADRSVRAEERPGRGHDTSIARSAFAAFQKLDTNDDRKLTLEELNTYCRDQMNCISSDTNMSDADKSAALEKFQTQQQFATAIFNKFNVNGEMNLRALSSFINQWDQYSGGLNTVA